MDKSEEAASLTATRAGGGVMNEFMKVVVLLVAWALMVMGVAFIGLQISKMKCEKDLPRNVSCTWQAP